MPAAAAAGPSNDPRDWNRWNKLTPQLLDPDHPDYLARYQGPLADEFNFKRSFTEDEIADVFDRLKHDVAFFAEFFWDIGLEAKQVEFANNCLHQKHAVARFNRQGGKSTIQSILTVHQLLFGKSCYIYSYAPTENQALKVIFARIIQLFQAQPLLYNRIAEWKKSGWILMKNGNCFQAQTANKDANLRGFSPSVIQVDESPFIHDDIWFADLLPSGAAIKGLTASMKRAVRKLGLSMREANRILAKMGTTTRIWETGTPAGRNHFYDNNQPGNDTHVTVQRWDECLHMDFEFIERERRRMPTDLFKQEYEGVFILDEGYAFKQDEVIWACQTTERDFERKHYLHYTAGLDLAESTDYTVMVVMECHGPVRKLVFMYVWEIGTPYPVVAKEFREFQQWWKPDSTWIDSTGQTGKRFEREFLHTGYYTVGFRYGQDSKTELMRNLKVLLNHGNLELWDDIALLREFKYLPEKRMPGGKYKYDKPKDKSADRDDRVQAISLACMAASVLLGDEGIAAELVYAHMGEFGDQTGWTAPDPYAERSTAVSPESRYAEDHAEAKSETPQSPWIKSQNKSPWSNPDYYLDSI